MDIRIIIRLNELISNEQTGRPKELASKLAEMTLEIKAKIGESGKIFGKVTTLQISDALATKGVDIDRKKISINVPVQGAGEFEAEVDLHREVKSSVKFVVVAE